jgi:hypothetical protein
LGLLTPNRTREQTTSHNLHPEQRSGTTVNRLPMTARPLRRESLTLFFFSLFAIPNLRTCGVFARLAGHFLKPDCTTTA